MKTIHATNKIAGAEGDAKPNIITRIRNWYRKKLGGTGIPIAPIDEETQKPVELTLFKYNVDINTGAGVFKVSQEAVTEKAAHDLVIGWYINNKLLIRPNLLGEAKTEPGKYKYRCTVDTGTGQLKYEIIAENHEQAIIETKVWFVRFKLRLKITLVGPVRQKQESESGKKQ